LGEAGRQEGRKKGGGVCRVQSSWTAYAISRVMTSSYQGGWRFRATIWSDLECVEQFLLRRKLLMIEEEAEEEEETDPCRAIVLLRVVGCCVRLRCGLAHVVEAEEPPGGCETKDP
jgi:hypothetical protein